MSREDLFLNSTDVDSIGGVHFFPIDGTSESDIFGIAFVEGSSVKEWGAPVFFYILLVWVFAFHKAEILKIVLV